MAPVPTAWPIASLATPHEAPMTNPIVTITSALPDAMIPIWRRTSAGNRGRLRKPRSPS